MTTAMMQEQKYTGEMSEINRSGDTRIIWDKDNPAEVAVAKSAFDTLVGKKKYSAFEVKGRKGDKGSQIRKFDPEAERIIMVPPMAGG